MKNVAGIDLSDAALSDELLSCFLQANKKNNIDLAFNLVIYFES